MSALRPGILRRAGAALLALAAIVPLSAQAPRAGNVAASRSYATSAPANPRLAARIDSILARPQLARAQWGIEVRDASTGQTLYARNAARLFIPASNLKLIVSAAAAHHLDPDHRFRTGVYAAGPVHDGVLAGDLILYGRGDPMISARYFPTRTAVFEMLADSLRARGIRRVEGRVVADESWFDNEQVRADWDAYDLRWWYAAPVGALGFNDNAIDFSIEPGPGVGSRPRITGQPESGAWSLENTARTVGARQRSTFDLGPGTLRGAVQAYGNLPLGSGVRTESYAVDNPARWTAIVFREVLESKGVAVARDPVPIVSHPDSSRVGTSTLLVEWRSPPLPQAIGPVLMNSQNWFAELLVKTLGKEVRGEGSWEAGLAVEREFLTRVVGIDSADFVLRDGSGLSERNRVTPRALVRLLDYVRRTPRQAIVRRALPLAGAQDGSLRSRLTDLRGRVAAKTGYIGGADSLSGFVTMPDGREIIFCIIANSSGEPSARMKAGIDDVVRAIAAVR